MSFKNEITFFFGAGAEDSFEMPLGYKYTLDTILSKRSKMTDALRDFYLNKTAKYSNNYFKDFLFTENSHTFKEIIYRSLNLLLEKDSEIDKETKYLLDLLNYNSENVQDKISNEEIRKIYEYVIIDIDKEPNKEKRPLSISSTDTSIKYKSLIENFSYYGSIEKDFSTIINPKEAGHRRFWRLINYFWSAYFSIIIPVLNLSSHFNKLKEYKENNYRYILNNLNNVVEYIYSKEFFLEIKEKYSNSYYHKVGQYFNKINAITTNYTPFLEFQNSFTKKIYLAGKLSLFEVPDELTIVDITKNIDLSNKFTFPYLLTQALIKPIINPLQIKEYNSFIETLENSNILVIIGYNINNNDDHINSIIRDFLIRTPTNRMYYSYYIKNKDDFREEIAINNLSNKLRISLEIVKNQITVIPNKGNPDEVLSMLKMYL